MAHFSMLESLSTRYLSLAKPSVSLWRCQVCFGVSHVDMKVVKVYRPIVSVIWLVHTATVKSFVSTILWLRLCAPCFEGTHSRSLVKLAEDLTRFNSMDVIVPCLLNRYASGETPLLPAYTPLRK